jgi:hypothetical protein
MLCASSHRFSFRICQRRSKNHEGSRSGGFFFRHQAWVGLSVGVSGLARRADSTLSFVFDIALSSGSFAGYEPDFKINWVGTQINYDLVSN